MRKNARESLLHFQVTHAPVGMQNHVENHENASLDVHRHSKSCEPLTCEYLIFGKGGNDRNRKSLSHKG